MKKKYWLVGGIIGLVLYVLLTIILIPFGSSSCGGGFFCVYYWFYPTLITLPVTYPFAGLVSKFNQSGIFILIGAVLVYFIVGAIIGWSYGKIKNRSKIKII